MINNLGAVTNPFPLKFGSLMEESFSNQKYKTAVDILRILPTVKCKVFQTNMGPLSKLLNLKDIQTTHEDHEVLF